MVRIVMLLAVFVMLGCANKELTPLGELVTVLDEKPEGCVELGPINEDRAYPARSEEEARDLLRNDAGKMGADTVVVNGVEIWEEKIYTTLVKEVGGDPLIKYAFSGYYYDCGKL